MNKIGGNKSAQLQKNVGGNDNIIHEYEIEWETVKTIDGFLDLMNESTNYLSYNAKVQESTHIWLCDFDQLPDGLTAENTRMIIDGFVYDVMMIDDPMGLHYHYEIYLKYTGEQYGGR